MIFIDRRQGSGDLARVWSGAALSDLHFADVAILGHGPDGIGMSCGIEIKQIAELVGDLHTGRFLGYQAPGLRRTYDVSWLVIEGRFKQGTHDELLVPRTMGWRQVVIGETKMSYSTTMFVLMTIAQKAGIHVWPTETRGQTLIFCQRLAEWWINGWESHHALDTFYTPPSGILQREHSLLRLWLKELRGLGWKRSADAETRFTSARDMANATWERFADVKGISETQAKKIVERIQA